MPLDGMIINEIRKFRTGKTLYTVKKVKAGTYYIQSTDKNYPSRYGDKKSIDNLLVNCIEIGC